MLLSHQLRLSVASIPQNTPRVLLILNRQFASSSISEEENEQIVQARKWLSSFTLESIPRKVCEVTFSRASGPGGQNVNKLNTKATLRLSLKEHGSFINPYILQKIRENSSYMTKRDELVIQCDTHRIQSKNTDECYQRLHSAIVNVAKLRGETTKEAMEHVEKIEKKNKERRLQSKKLHSSKKSSRRGPRDD